MNSRRWPVFGALCWAVALGGCLDAPTPEGFARLDNRASVRAVSSDGVMYRVRRVDNEPKADLAFWREALKKRMLEAGYAVLRDGEVSAGDTPGYLLQLAAPVGQQDYAYAVAIFVHGDEITLVEAAGEVTRFDRQREKIVAALSALRLE